MEFSVTVKNVARQIDVFALARRAIKLDQRHLDLRMPGDNCLLVCAGPVVRQQKVVDEANAGIEQSSVAGGAIIGDCALQHVADAIEFVARRLGVIQHAFRFPVTDKIGVQIAARFLSCNHLVNHRVGGLSQSGLIAGLQCESNRLGPLIDI